MMRLDAAFRHFFLLAIILLVFSCVSVRKHADSSSAQSQQSEEKGLTLFRSYKFTGHITNEKGIMCYAIIEAIGDSGLIKRVMADFETGAYDLVLPAESTIRASQFRITASGYDTLTTSVDYNLYEDSLFVKDFTMNQIPVDYHIVRGYQDHIGGSPISVDTIWLDKRGNPFPEKKDE